MFALSVRAACPCHDICKTVANVPLHLHDAGPHEAAADAGGRHGSRHAAPAAGGFHVPARACGSHLGLISAECCKRLHKQQRVLYKPRAWASHCQRGPLPPLREWRLGPRIIHWVGKSVLPLCIARLAVACIQGPSAANGHEADGASAAPATHCHRLSLTAEFGFDAEFSWRQSVQPQAGGGMAPKTWEGRVAAPPAAPPAAAAAAAAAATSAKAKAGHGNRTCQALSRMSSSCVSSFASVLAYFDM